VITAGWEGEGEMGSYIMGTQTQLDRNGKFWCSIEQGKGNNNLLSVYINNILE
jgi:hypothetical protein